MLNFWNGGIDHRLDRHRRARRDQRHPVWLRQHLFRLHLDNMARAPKKDIEAEDENSMVRIVALTLSYCIN